MYCKAHVHGLLVDPIKEMPILLLRDDRDGRILPIWIGQSEANAIALHLENIHVPRPMTHDLLCHILDSAGGSLIKVLIRELKDHTYFADLVLSTSGRETQVDARPSDAIAMAVRVDAPIFVEESLYELAESVGESVGEEDSMGRWLGRLGTGDMGEYEM